MKKLLFSTLFFISSFSIASEEITKNDIIKKAEASAKATFKNLTFTEFKESPIPGIFELKSAGSIVYYVPEKEFLIFGEIFDKKGKSLTQESLVSKREGVTSEEAIIKDYLKYAIVVGDKDAPKTIIEFTDPDCPYCRNYDRWINKHESSSDVKRLVFFDITLHEKTARPKVEHILCSSNPQKELEYMFLGIKPTQFKTCDNAEEILKMHAMASAKVGVSGTPSFILDGNLTLGFRTQILNTFINK